MISSSKVVMNAVLCALLAPVASLATGGFDKVFSVNSVLLFVFMFAACNLSAAMPDKKQVAGPAKKPAGSGDKTADETTQVAALSNQKRDGGQVKWFNSSKGFGFITRDDGQDIFVHFRSIRGDGRRFLRDGQRVDFVTGHGEKGLQAEDVVLLEK